MTAKELAEKYDLEVLREAVAATPSVLVITGGQVPVGPKKEMVEFGTLSRAVLIKRGFIK